MRKIALSSFLLLAFTVAAFAQESSATLPANVLFPAQLVTKLNSHKAKVGDEVKLEVTANLRGPGGVVVLPKGAKLIGSVTEVKDRNAVDGQSELSFLITKAEWHGGSMALHAAPTAVTSPRVKMDRGSGGDSGFGGERGGGTGGHGAATDTSSMIAAARANEIKGVECRDSGDPKIGYAFFSHRDVSLPSGVIITLRQLKAEE